jgi:hypothetical protein
MNKTRDLALLILLVLGITFLLSLTFLRCEVTEGRQGQKTIRVCEYKLVPQ